MKTEQEYLDMADEAAEKKQPFSAVVYAFMALIMIFREVRDVLVRDRTVLAPFVQPAITHDPPYTISVTGSNDGYTPLTSICPWCGFVLTSGGDCINIECPEGA
jgi:hypothetical protein